MAGKPGMHKKVLNPAAVERIRERIQADRIISKLENHILDGEEMSASQVSAALGLLKKRVPDLSAVEMTGEDGGPVKTISMIELVSLK
jgi:hypothetical protein